MFFVFSLDILPFLYQILDGNSSRLQDLIIRKIPELAQQIEYSILISVSSFLPITFYPLRLKK